MLNFGTQGCEQIAMKSEVEEVSFEKVLDLFWFVLELLIFVKVLKICWKVWRPGAIMSEIQYFQGFPQFE